MKENMKGKERGGANGGKEKKSKYRSLWRMHRSLPPSAVLLKRKVHPLSLGKRTVINFTFAWNLNGENLCLARIFPFFHMYKC